MTVLVLYADNVIYLIIFGLEEYILVKYLPSNKKAREPQKSNKKLFSPAGRKSSHILISNNKVYDARGMYHDEGE